MIRKPSRRDFIKIIAIASATDASSNLQGQAESVTTGVAERERWRRWAERLATPLLPMLAARQLKATMPVETAAPEYDRTSFTHLEGFARLLCGLAPWLELGHDCGNWPAVAREALDAATDPHSPDFVNFTAGTQPLVDSAFLAQALLRAPTALWQTLPERVRKQVIAGLKATRVIKPWENNWVLFASMVETFLHSVGETLDKERLAYGLRRHAEWYRGDGWYGDGPEFHTDYYNAYVIQPMLVEILDHIAREEKEWAPFHVRALARLTRFAAIQERLIAPDGSFPVVGRSITYRAGAFQGLALAALRQLLPPTLPPAQVRRALTSVLQRTLEAPATFDPSGWLRIGLAGAQPALAERYISTGSLYLCSTALLPLGLDPNHAFWSTPDVPTTWEKAWSGQNLPADTAMRRM